MGTFSRDLPDYSPNFSLSIFPFSIPLPALAIIILQSSTSLTENCVSIYITLLFVRLNFFMFYRVFMIFLPSVFLFWIHIITNLGENFILFFLICNNGLQGRAFFFFFFDLSFDFSFPHRFSLHKVLLIFKKHHIWYFSFSYWHDVSIIYLYLMYSITLKSNVSFSWLFLW